MQGLALGSGVGAELLGQGPAEALVGGQGGSRLAGGGGGGHHGPPGRLVQAVGGGGGGGVGQGPAGVANGQGGLPGQAPGPGGQPLGLAPGRHRPVGVGLVGQERPPPEQGQGTLGGGQGQGRLAGQPGLGLGGQPGRLLQVNLDPRPGHEPPAVPAAGDHLRAEHGPQPAHQCGQVGVGVGRRPSAPQGLDQHVGRDDLAPPGQQQLEQGAALAAGQLLGRHLAAVHGHGEDAQHLHPEVGLLTHARDCRRRRPPLARPAAGGLSPGRRRSPGCRRGRRPRPSAPPRAGRPARPAPGRRARAGAPRRRRSRRRAPRG